MQTALYTGSFDPLTNGHFDIIEQARDLCDRLVVGIGVHPSKTPIFTASERAELIRAATAPLFADGKRRLEIINFSGLAIEAARQHGAKLFVRGLRDSSDLDYEMRMAAMNASMAPEVRTIFLPASPAVRPIEATLVRQIAALGGDVTRFVPPVVAQAFVQRRAEQARDSARQSETDNRPSAPSHDEATG